uniref:Putative secreted peptide n=1 Tax=Anopheles braziliensis TaxID=58242 RepID=A0A2M3ZX42_9DIPT
MPESTFSAAISAMLSLVCTVADPRWGMTTALGSLSSSSSAGSGSGETTSRPAAKMVPFLSAATSAL